MTTRYTPHRLTDNPGVLGVRGELVHHHPAAAPDDHLVDGDERALDLDVRLQLQVLLGGEDVDGDLGGRHLDSRDLEHGERRRHEGGRVTDRHTDILTH